MINNYFDIFGFQLKIYSILLLICILSMIEFAKKVFLVKYPNDFTKSNIDDMTIIIALSGLLGARIWYVISDLGFYLSNPFEIFMVWKGGIAAQGSIIGMYFGAKWYLNKNKINVRVYDLFEEFFLFLLIGQAIGRWGNFYNQEIFGFETTRQIAQTTIIAGLFIQFVFWLTVLIIFYKQVSKVSNKKLKNKLIFKDSTSYVKYLGFGFISIMLIRILATSYGQAIVEHMHIRGAYRFPLFIVEGSLNTIAFATIWYLNNDRINTIKAPMYFISYGTIRASLELLRHPQDIMKIGPIPISFVMSIVFVIIGIKLIMKQGAK